MATDDQKEVISQVEEEKESPEEREKELVAFVVSHTDRWRDYRDQNYIDDFDRYERIFRGKWSGEDKQRESERSRVISPATQQAIETRHAEKMEAVFGNGVFFDIEDDLGDKNTVDVENIKRQLYEDFKQDKIRKAIEATDLLANIYGTGIAEIVVGKEKFYYPSQQPIPNTNQVAYGVSEQDRFYVRLVPVNPKNFLFDPNGTSVDDCMGVAIEKYTSVHKIAQGIASGAYKNVDIGTLYESDALEPTQENIDFQDDKLKILTYYGLVPREYLTSDEVVEIEGISDEMEDYSDMVEAIVVIANGDVLLKAEENPYMMKDRPVIVYQDDTVPNRLMGRGTAEKAYNMQCAIDGSMRSHMDALALTSAPMMGMDATRLPRGAKFQVKPGGNFMVNGNPSEILYPFKFGVNDGQSMQTSKEFERMLQMATGTIDSSGMVSQVSRDGQLDMATATLIKKYKRTLVNFQEDFLIPFIKKAAWRYMQYNPERYPSVDVKFVPTGVLGVIAREHEQQQLAFLMQTLGAQSPLTPILMQGIIQNSSISNKEEMSEQLKQASQPNPQQQQMEQAHMQQQMELVQAQIESEKSKALVNQMTALKLNTEAQLLPEQAKANIMAAISKNLPDADAAATREFDRRVELANLMLKEKDIDSNERIALTQMTRQ